jgi:hypothetical protein
VKLPKAISLIKIEKLIVYYSYKILLMGRKPTNTHYDNDTYYDNGDDFNFCLGIIIIIITAVYLIPLHICTSIRTSLFS